MKKNKHMNIRNIFKLIIATVSLSILIMTVNISFVKAQAFEPFTQITNDIKSQKYPVIDGDYVVYTDYNVFGDDGIYLYNIVTGETDTIEIIEAALVGSVDISGDRVVWQQKVDGQWDIYNYLISRPDLGAYPLITNEGDQKSPAIHEDLLVWYDVQEEFDGNIFLYNISTAETKQITFDEDGAQYDPDVYGNYVVWVNVRNGDNVYDIYMYDIANDEIIALTDDGYTQQNPCIHSNRIIWEDNRNVNWDLYMCNLDFGRGTVFEYFNWVIHTGYAIGHTNEFDQKNPAIYGDMLVFSDNRSYNWDIYIYKFINPIVGITEPLVTEARHQDYPAISGNRVVWMDERDWNGTGFYRSDIWMWEQPPGADLAVTLQSEPETAALGEEFRYAAYVSNFGNQNTYDVSFTATIPDDMTYLWASSEKFGGCQRSGTTVTCTLDSITVGNTDTVYIALSPLAEGEFTASATVSSLEEDLNPDNNYSQCNTNVVWKLPKEVGDGGMPAVAVDSYGKVHFCYLSAPYGGQVMYATNRYGGLTHYTIDEDPDNYSPAITIDSKNNIHIAYGKGNGYDNNHIRYLMNSNNVWSIPDTVALNMGSSEFITIRTDKNDSVHISCMTSLWSDGSIWYFRKNGDWLKEMVKDKSYNSSSFDLDTSGFAHFVYYDLSSFGFCYKTNSPGGTWSAETSPDPSWQGGQMESLVTDIAVDRESQLHVSYVGSAAAWENEDYKYATKSVSGWTNDTVLPGSFAGGPNVIDADPAGNAHMVVNDYVNNRLVYLHNSEGSWTRHTIDYNQDWGRNSDICMDNYGYTHIVYARDEKIYYVTNTIPLPDPEISVSPDELDFVLRNVGDTTAIKKVTIKNTGDADLILTDIKVVWRDSVNFSVSGTSCDVIAPGDTCSIDVIFHPKSIGDKHALLWISSNDPTNPDEGVSLLGTGMQGIIRDYGSQEFGEVYIGDSAVNLYTLKNEGNTGLVVQGIFLENGNTGDFFYRDLPDVPFSIQDGDSVNFNLVFKPSGTGERSVTMKIYTTDLDLNRVLTGTGVEKIFSVSGEIRLPDNTAVTEGVIFVVELGQDGRPVHYYYKPLEGSNSFEINGVPESTITLEFDPDPDANPGYLRTYLGDTPFWDEAQKVTMDEDFDNVVITLVEAPPPGTGSSDVSGQISEGDGKKSAVIVSLTGQEMKTEALEGIPVYLLNDLKEIAASDVSDSNGEFSFKDISEGSYSFLLDYQGISMAEGSPQLVISEPEQEWFILATIFTDEITYTLELLPTDITAYMTDGKIESYPNPFSNTLMIKVYNETERYVRIEVFNSLGTLVDILYEDIAPAGKQIYRWNADNFDNGVYFIRYSTEHEDRVLKVLKAE